MSRLKFWRGMKPSIRPAITFVAFGKQYMVRFGMDDFMLWDEAYSGKVGRPKNYWYGPFGLTLRIEDV